MPLSVALLVEGGGILPPAPNCMAGLLVPFAGGGKNGRLDLGIFQCGMTLHIVGGVGQETVNRFCRGRGVARGREKLMGRTPVKICGGCGNATSVIPNINPPDAIGHEIGGKAVGVCPQRGVERLTIKIAIVRANFADVVRLNILLDLRPRFQERNGLPGPPLPAHALEILGQLVSVVG